MKLSNNNLPAFSSDELRAELARRGESAAPDSLARLRAANLVRLPKFGHGNIHSLGAWGPMQWGCAVAGEVGELCNVLKKYERQMPTDPDRDTLTADIGEEIADVVIYLDLLAAYFAMDMRRLIESKFNKTSKKHHLPDRL